MENKQCLKCYYRLSFLTKGKVQNFCLSVLSEKSIIELNDGCEDFESVKIKGTKVEKESLKRQKIRRALNMVGKKSYREIQRETGINKDTVNRLVNDC